MGVGLIWKPKGIPSQKYLGEIKKTLNMKTKGRKGIGHSGTLDPFATGLLLIGWNAGTKLIHSFEGFDKSYEAEIILGATSSSLDTESDYEFASEETLQKLKAIHEDQLIEFLKSKIGSFEQQVPLMSAIHVAGKRAYEWGRSGEEPPVEMPTRQFFIRRNRHLSLKKVTIEGRELLSWKVFMELSKGSYVRSIARDWAQELIAFPGMLENLTRTSVGPYTEREPFEGIKNFQLMNLAECGAEITPLSNEEEQRLMKSGLWKLKPENARKNKYLINSQGAVLAFWSGNDQKLKKVFPKDPLSLS